MPECFELQNLLTNIFCLIVFFKNILARFTQYIFKGPLWKLYAEIIVIYTIKDWH